MDIFYLKKSEFLPCIKDESLLAFSDGRNFNSKDKEIEHLCGIFLTEFVAKNIFDIENPKIEIINNKPFFKSRQMYFSISHSNDIVLTAFNSTNIGADIEYMRDRNFKPVLERYHQKIKNPTKEAFYRFWTLKEAEIKLNSETQSIFSKIIEQNYVLTCVANDILVSNFNIKKLVCNGENINLKKELETPQMIKILS